MTDLTPERLDELDGWARSVKKGAFLTTGWSEFRVSELRILIATARRTIQVERERDEANEKLTRYRALTDTFDHERQQYHEERDEARAERDALRSVCATIAGFDNDNPSRAKWRETKRIVRDALLATDAAVAREATND